MLDDGTCGCRADQIDDGFGCVCPAEQIEIDGFCACQSSRNQISDPMDPSSCVCDGPATPGLVFNDTTEMCDCPYWDMDMDPDSLECKCLDGKIYDVLTNTCVCEAPTQWYEEDLACLCRKNLTMITPENGDETYCGCTMGRVPFPEDAADDEEQSCVCPAN